MPEAISTRSIVERENAQGLVQYAGTTVLFITLPRASSAKALSLNLGCSWRVVEVVASKMLNLSGHISVAASHSTLYDTNAMRYRRCDKHRDGTSKLGRYENVPCPMV